MQKASFSSVLRCHLWRMHWIIFKQFDPKCSIPVRLLHNWYERIGENQFATKYDSKELFICAILCREQYGLRYYLLGDFELHCDDLLQISKRYERTCTVLVSQNEYYVVDWYYIATVHRSPCNAACTSWRGGSQFEIMLLFVVELTGNLFHDGIDTRTHKHEMNEWIPHHLVGFIHTSYGTTKYSVFIIQNSYSYAYSCVYTFN